MCLEASYGFGIRPADRTIKAYKVVYKMDDGTFRSPFHNYQYMVGRTECSGLRLEVDGVVDFGLHTFADLSEAVFFAAPESRMGITLFTVLECEIPEGSRYVIGRWNYLRYQTFKSYASQLLLPIREVER